MSGKQTIVEWFLLNVSGAKERVQAILGLSPGDNPIPLATETTPGVSERATIEEAEAGIDTSRHVTPAGVAAAIANKGYIEYKVILEQTGENAPTVTTTLVNELSGTPVATKIDVGDYRLTLSGAFPNGKTFVLPGGSWNNGIVSASRANLNYISIKTYDSAMVPADDMLQNTALLVQVYP